MSSKWDQLSESKVVIFQINLQGKDVGAMEFDAMCRTGLFTWERQIVVPTTGARYFSCGTEPYFQKAKIVARDIFCSRQDLRSLPLAKIAECYILSSKD